MFDSVKYEKEKAIARFNRFRRIVKLWQIFEVLVVFGLVSWTSARVPAVLKVTGGYFVDFSAYLLNHHVVFLIGNAIIVLLFMLCRQNDASVSGGGDFYDDYVKSSEATAVHQREPALPSPPVTEGPPAEESVSGDGEKQLVVRADETKRIPQCDDVAAAIEKAAKQIERFQRTQSEKLKREISVRPPPELRRSETDNCRKTVSSMSVDAAEIENLSSEEFRRRVDAFIDKHWGNRTTKRKQFAQYENYRLLNMA
ncbi:hypothetical protein DH2020_035272 [Rehmannia glutinosa]|uniref:DUF4408 domain-containing protein n=1 Tax=Rehmannia glutinosa TaxID=99300 RepID=A0ABR0V837_REHGL